MVYTLVLEANAEGIVSSSLTWRTKFFKQKEVYDTD